MVCSQLFLFDSLVIYLSLYDVQRKEGGEVLCFVDIVRLEYYDLRVKTFLWISLRFFYCRLLDDNRF
jgi:hypothetical protein